VRFIVTKPFVSSLLRGKHVADALGAHCHVGTIGDATGEVLVFVKDAPAELIHEARERRNLIVYDPLDLYCYGTRTASFDPVSAHIVIVPSVAAGEFYRSKGFVSARFAVIPHQWDARIMGAAPQDRCRAGYIGHDFNCPEWWDGDRHTEMTDSVLAATARFNLHLSLNARKETHILLKPAVKVATAAAVLANVVAYPDPAAIELLGSDYPYLVHDTPQEAVRRAKGSFGSVEWRRARARMAEVRERTKLEAVAALYARLEKGEKAQAG